MVPGTVSGAEAWRRSRPGAASGVHLVQAPPTSQPQRRPQHPARRFPRARSAVILQRLPSKNARPLFVLRSASPSMLHRASSSCAVRDPFMRTPPATWRTKRKGERKEGEKTQREKGKKQGNSTKKREKGEGTRGKRRRCEEAQPANDGKCMRARVRTKSQAKSAKEGSRARCTPPPTRHLCAVALPGSPSLFPSLPLLAGKQTTTRGEVGAAHDGERDTDIPKGKQKQKAA